MNCDQIRDHILLDYIDNELDPPLHNQITNHLSTCTSCQEFHQQVLQTTSLPFKNTELLTPPDSVWQKISNSLDSAGTYPAPGVRPLNAASSSKTAASSSQTTALTSLKNHLHFLTQKLFQPIPVSAGVFASILLAVWFTRPMPVTYTEYNPVQNYVTQEMQYLVGENGKKIATARNEEYLGTNLELFLL